MLCGCFGGGGGDKARDFRRFIGKTKDLVLEDEEPNKDHFQHEIDVFKSANKFLNSKNQHLIK